MDINIYVTSSNTSSERKISPQWTIQYLKQRLELITGIPPQYQKIQYFPIPSSNDSVTIADPENYNEQNDAASTVSSIQLISYSRLHVVDSNPNSNIPDLYEEPAEDFEFKLLEEEYQKRNDSVLNWKRNAGLGRFNPGYQDAVKEGFEEDKKVVKNIKVGDRCRVISISSERRGVVRFVGKINLLDGGESEWVGLEFDEPVGKNNGSIDGVKIFECRDKHGSFVRPKQVEVGDFPEEELFSDEEM